MLLCLQRARIPRDLPNQIHFSRSGFLLKIVSFSNLFPRPKKSEKQLQQHGKNTNKSIPKFFDTDFHENSIFARPSMRKQRSGSPKHRKIELEINKTWLRNKLKKINKAFWTLKLTQNRSRNHSKFDKKSVIWHLASILLLPWSSRVVPNPKIAS